MKKYFTCKIYKTIIWSKKVKIKTKLVVLFLSSLILSCTGVNSEMAKQTVSAKQMQEMVDNVSIEIKKNENNTIESYQANVKQYSYNQRIPGQISAPSEYRLSLKKSGNSIFTRIDFDSSYYGDGKARSVICDGKETVVFDSLTKEVEARIPLTEEETKISGDFGGPMFGRLALDSYIAKCRQLAFDLQEDSENNIMCVTIPVSNVSARTNNETETAVYSRLYFDTQEDVLLGGESKTIDEEGTVITTSNNYLYKEVDGEPVLIGEMLEVTNDFPYEIDTSDYMLPIVESEDDIPEVTEEELAEMVKDGGEVYEFEQILGDPSNPDYTEVIVKTYDDIEINTLEDEYFRIPL